MRKSRSRLGDLPTIILGQVAALVLVANGPAIAGVTTEEVKAKFGPELQVLGPVQQVDIGNGLLLVVGQQVSIAKISSVSFNGVVVDDRVSAIQRIQPGDLIAVYGAFDGASLSVKLLNYAYVPGATTIFVSGKLSAVNSAIGRAQISALTVDFTPSLSDVKFSNLVVGESVDVAGIQPIANGLLLAESVNRVDANSIVGTGAQDKSIVGTGAQAASIVGTGAQATSIVGTGALNKKAESIVGTGAQAASIVGTGAQAVSIVGTGARATSIVGTGALSKKAESIVGTGAQALSIVGTGATLN